MKQTLQRLALTALALSAPFAAQAQTSDLLISEYIEGSSFNKAVELYNGTAGSLNLATGQYRLELYTNGASTPSQSIALTGTIAAGATLVLCHASADTAILAACNVQSSGTINFNGDDALVLRKASASAGNGTVVDSLGQVGFDPGSEWGTGAQSTADNTIRRKNTVCAGDTTIGDAFTPSTEWDGFANNTFGGLGSHVAHCATGPVLDIGDNAGAEGDSGTRSLDITISLSAPAPAGGVGFTVSDAGTGTATAGTDYMTFVPFQAGIAPGQDRYTFQIVVYGDNDDEPNESVVLTLSGVEGDVTAGDLSAVATIQNDDAPITPINDIQGNGTASPLDGDTVTTEGVITVLRGNGFFIQSTAEHDDGDATTSDGLWVFTSGVPAASLAVGDVVQVSGTVEEFQPVSFTYPVTELLPSSIVETGTAALPAPVAITAADFAGPLIEPDVLEHLEGMYVHIAAGKIVAPTRSTTTEFEVVVAGVQRPIREAGISIFDPFDVPTALEATIPYFDANQERIKLRPTTGSTPLVDARGSVADVFGALDFVGSSSAVNSWQVWYDPSRIQIVSGTPRAVADADADDVTIAGFNLEWFFVNSQDGQSGTEAQRRTKIAAVVCDWLKSPDILATSEVDDLTSLQGLASEINAGCASAPLYEAHMLDTDVGNQQRLGFLISKRLVDAGTPRVELTAIQQHNEATLLKDPSGNPVAGEELNDRPPLRLQAVVHFADGRKYPVTVIAVHQKSLIAVDSTEAGRNGYPTEGARNRAKRGQQAVELAKLVHDIQTGAIGGGGNQKIVLVGDFNSFDVNDGYVDVMGITTGHPAPATEVIDWMDSPLSPANGGTPLVVGNTLIEDPEERYSYIFNNINQSLDHAVINQALLSDPAVTGIAIDHARVNSDFRTSLKSVYFPTYNTTDRLPLASSDHDPVRLKIGVARPLSADLSQAWTTRGVSTRGVFTTMTVHNASASAINGAQVRIDAEIPANSGLTVGGPAGWTCKRLGDASFLCTASIAIPAGGNASFTVDVRPRTRFDRTDVIRLKAQSTVLTDPIHGDNSVETVITMP